jgi:hypothetical protein
LSKTQIKKLASQLRKFHHRMASSPEARNARVWATICLTAILASATAQKETGTEGRESLPPEPLASWTPGENPGHMWNASPLGAVSEEEGMDGRQAWAFDGIDSLIMTDLAISPDDFPEVTLMFWMMAKTEGEGDDKRRQILLAADDGGYDRTLVIEEGQLGAATGEGIWWAAPITTNTWHHVAAVYHTGGLRVYLDGREMEFPEGPLAPQPSTEPLSIGGSRIWGQFFEGKIQDLKIFDSALPKEAVTAAYNQGRQAAKAASRGQASQMAAQEEATAGARLAQASQEPRPPQPPNQQEEEETTDQEVAPQAQEAQGQPEAPAQGPQGASTAFKEDAGTQEPATPENPAEPANWEGDFHIQIEGQRRVRAKETTRMATSEGNVKGWALTVPLPPELDTQKDVCAYLVNETTGQTMGRVTKEGSPLARPILQWEMRARPAEKNQVTFSYVFEVTTIKQSLRRGKAPQRVQDLPRKEFSQFTRPTEGCNWKSKEFQEWSTKNNMKKAPLERDLAFAARAQHFMIGQTPQEIEGVVIQESSAPYLEGTINVRAGSCGHKATLFAGIMRASGIPARVRVGRWAGLGGEANPLNVHVKCDFWAQNIGWVNVEFAEPAHPDNPQGAFGRDADFITYHLEVNLELEVWGKPRPAHILQWADILPLGDFKHEGQSSSSRSTVETLWSREMTGLQQESSQ